MNDDERRAFGKYLSSVATAKKQELEAIDELLSELGKPILAAAPRKATPEQFDSLKWTTKEGTKGNYEQARNDNSENFRTVSQYVKAHKGFCNIYGYKVWLHNNDENVIDRKR